MQFIANQVRPANVRRVTRDGKEYLVVPVVLISNTEQVLNSELVTLDEIGRFPDAWNDRPVTISHPRRRGRPVSAGSLDVQNRERIGRIYNAAINGNLRGEYWLDLTRINELEGQVGEDAREAVQRFEAGQMVDTSTGYFRDLEPTAGELDGQRYEGIARNIRPDHVAILLRKEGACSVADGCGAPRINQQEHDSVIIALIPRPEDAGTLALDPEDLPDGSEAVTPGGLHLTVARLGDVGEMENEQARHLDSLASWARATAVTRANVTGIGRFTRADDAGRQVVYASVDGPQVRAYRRELSRHSDEDHTFLPHITLARIPAGAPMPDIQIDDREIVFDRIVLAFGDTVTAYNLQGEPIQLNLEDSDMTEQEMVALIKRGIREGVESLQLNGGNRMTEEERQELVKSLVANEDAGWKAEDFEEMDDAVLQRIAAMAEAGEEADETDDADDPTPESQPAMTADAVGSAVTKALDAAFSGVGGLEGVTQALSGVQANAQQQKGALVNKLVANERCAFDEAELSAMTPVQLEKLERSLRPANYLGAGGVFNWQQVDDDDAEHEMPMPALFPAQNGGND